MAMAGDRIGAAGGFNKDIGPNHAGANMDGGDFGDADGHFVTTEPGAFVSRNGFVADFNPGREKEIPPRPATRSKHFGWHKVSSY